MIARRVPTLLIASFCATPCVIGHDSENVRGKLLPDLPQHLEYAQRDLSIGQIDGALAHADLVLLREPITYSVSFDGVSDLRKPECLAAVRDAAAMWESALYREIRLVEVDAGSPKQASIEIMFVAEVKQDGSSVAGFVNWKRRVVAGDQTALRTEIKADIKMRTVQPGGEPMSLDHMRHSAAHELGHIFGLDDSAEYGDIMGPLDLKNPVAGFEATELESLREIRSAAQDLRTRALSRQVASPAPPPTATP